MKRNRMKLCFLLILSTSMILNNISNANYITTHAANITGTEGDYNITSLGFRNSEVRKNASETYTLTKDIPTQVEVMLENGDVTVGYHKSNTIEIKAKYIMTGRSEQMVNEILNSAKISAVRKNDSLRIQIIEKNSKKDIWDYIYHEYRNDRIRELRADLEILLPDAVKDLQVTTECGDITVNSIKVDVNAVSETGSVEITSVHGNVTTSLETGSVTVDTLQGDIEASSETGSIYLTSVKGEAKASSETGSVYLSSMQGEVNASSETGMVSVDSMNGKIDASSETGSIDARNMIFKGKSQLITETGSINCSLSKGKTAKSAVRLFSETGRIKIDVSKLPISELGGNNDYSDEKYDEDDNHSLRMLVNKQCNISAKTYGNIKLAK